MTTNRCNLRCSYCINSAKRGKAPSLKASAPKIIKHITEDSQKNHYDPVIITFYGGEPLLETEFLREIMDGTRKINPGFHLFTNGTLLSENNLPLLNKMNMISISMDADSEIYDSTRGKGTHKKVMDNYLKIRKKLKASTLAFVTLTLKSSLYRSIAGLTDHFDNVFWFLENSGTEIGIEGFLKQYDSDLDRVLSRWMANLRKGKVLNLVPFQGLYDVIMEKHVYSGLPCGIGENYQALAIDGSIYTCEDSYHNKIGDMDTGADMEKAHQHGKFVICGSCAVKRICAGRCVVPHLNFSPAKVEFYCKCSKMLIEKFMSALPEIKKIVSTGKISENQLMNRITRFTDVIP